MSFKFNSDKEQIRANAPSIIGDSEIAIRSGTGSDEKEVMRALLEPTTKTPRVGINRTGNRIDRITVTNEGSGYTTQPTVTLSAPTGTDPVQALASATVSPEGRISGILIDNPGSGYESPPSVSITGGNGLGATAQAFLDTVDYELDINGAIRTSTSIISDTARILNLDIDNLVTPDAAYRAPNLKTFVNNTGTPWAPDRLLQKNTFVYRGPNVYQSVNTGTTSANPLDPPLHIDGIQLNGNALDDPTPGVQFKHIGFRVSDPNEVYYNETGEAGLYPRSITPLLGDKSDKIATTEYVLNLATNDVGGRIYVSQQIGNDENDGRSPVNPVRTIKKACQLAWETPGVKESIIVAGGDYTEDNPISIPPDASVVGDNLRLVIIRPANPRKHIFKFGDKNYVIGVTYRDQEGADTFTWDFAMVFDDKQRITYDYDANGDFTTQFPVGHQIFGESIFRATYQSNGGLANLVSGLELRGVNAGGIVTTRAVSFNETTGPSAYQSGTFDFVQTSGSVNAGETLVYGGGGVRFQPSTVYSVGDIVWTEEHVYNVQTGGTSGENNPTHDSGDAANGPDTLVFTYLRDTYSLVTTDIISIRPEGEVVFENRPNLTDPPLPIYRIDFSLQGDPSIATGGFGDYGTPEDLGGIVFYTNPLVESDNIHDFKEGEEILIQNLSTSSPDLSFLNGKQRIYKVIEDPDGRSRRFVIPKKNLALTDANYDPGQFAQVQSYSKSVTLSLLNSPFKFNEATPVARRYQDAVNQIKNNREFIADEVVGKINDQFKKEYFAVYDIGGAGGFDFKIYLGTQRFVHTYVSGGTATFGGTTYNITNFVYDNIITGEATITIDNSPAGVVEDDLVLLADILVECDIDGVTTQKTYPSFSIPVSDEKCRRDIRHFLNALCQDLEFGSNNNIIDAAKKYIDGTNSFIDETIDFEIIQTVRAIEYARELAIYAMRKWRTADGLVSDPVYTPVYSSLPRYFDPTVIDDTSPSGACNNVKAAIDTLSYLFVDVLANDASGTILDAAYLIARNRDHIADEAYKDAQNQFPSLTLSNIDERKCRRDINYVISALLRDLVLGGNFGTVSYAELYFTGTQLTGIPASELPATRYAFTAVRDLCIEAMRNWNDASGNPTTASFTTIPRFTDSTILADPAGNPLCATVESAITTSFGILDDILGSVVAPGATTKTRGTLLDTAGIYNYPDSYITDFNGTKVTVKATYDDYPIIEASPYTQNASIISKLGGGGALIDGSKVKQPNCPFPGLNLDGTAKFPNQGKSMVASAFTIVSEGGIGYKIIEDGYTQLVSVFCIFTADGVLAESGGYASITNSATNFGIYALRARGFRKEAYEFDVASISNVSSTPTGRTIFSVSGLGREPLEHYVVKIDGFENVNPEIEYFVDAVEGVTVGPPFSAQLTLESGSGGPAEFKNSSTGNVVSLASLVGETIRLHRPSIVNSSSHTWEYAGSGTSYLALPENGGTKIEANEQVSEDYGRTYVSGTDELGDFKVGTFARIENRTGNITFTGTVTISEVEFLKLKGGDVVVTGFDNSNTLGGANSSDSKLPTQKAVKDFITNSLGPYINKPYSTNPVPRALVELTDSGKISLDQIPALRPFSVFTVADQAERLALEGALAGDIAIQQDTSTSFILNNDLTSLYLGFAVDSSLVFNVGDVYTGTPSTGRIQATEYREGVVHTINITDGGSGYTVAPTIQITGGNPSAGAVAATAVATIANGEVVTITITENASYVGGFGYTTQPSVNISAPAGAGTAATADAFIESRLYGNIVNNIKMLDTDTFDDSDSPSANTVNITRVVNTSASTASNWVSLSSDSVGVGSLTGPGVISTTLLGSEAANSFTFLRGDQRYAKAVQSLKGAETRYFARLYAQASTGASSFIFEGLSDVLKGHEIVANIGGIANDTTVNGVTVVGNLTTVSFNNPITSTIAVGTVIEFNRGTSPLIFDSTNTGGEFIDSVVIANPGTGFTDGQYFDVPLDAPAGTNGNDLRVNIIVGENGQSGQVTTCTVTNSGSGYTQDFQVAPNPTIIGSGSNLVLLAKVATTQKQFANIALDVQRVSDLTISQDLFGTIGVARFKKSQFNIGDEGNGSVSIKMGPDSGLDADLLDGQQGSYYLNGAFFVDSSINPDKLASGTYSIDISGRSTNTLRLDTGTSNANANPGPSDAVQGVTLQTLFNSSNGLLSAFPSVDTGSSNSAKHLVMTLRNGESGGDATFGGVRQLAFANDDRIYFRGSGDAVTSYGSWYEVWNSGNMGIDSGLDADKLDNKEGIWYQDGWNIKTNEIFDTRLPTWRSSTAFRDKVEVKSYAGAETFYRILVRQNLDISPGGDFEANKTIDMFDVNKISVGDFVITATDQDVDQNDSSNTYTMLIGRLSSGGNINAAVYLGYAGDEREFEHWEIYDDNTVQYAEMGNSSGTGFLRLGRNDGIAATQPYIYFNSSQAQAVDNNGDPTYNSAIIADGGNATEGSGTLEFKVVNENELKVNNNIIWNAGNVAFNDTNIVSTASLKSAVMRDTSGNFSAGTITASLTGAASLNVLKTGDTMTGGLTITGNNNISVQGTGSLDIGGNTTLGADLTVDSGTFYVNSTNNRVNIGQTADANPVKFNVYSASGSLNFQSNLALSSQTTIYQSSVYNQVNGGESGIILQHGASAASQWGITAHRTGANVGELIIRTRTANATSAERLKISNGGDITPGATNDQELGSGSLKWSNIHTHITTVKDSVRVGDGSANAEADLQLRGGGTGNGGGRGFRLGSNIGGGADVFEIYSSQTNGDDDWKSLASGEPALAIQGTNNRVGINTNSFNGTDTTVTPNVSRDYILNVNGDLNIDGDLYQNNALFVTSRWNEVGTNIYRNSRVGIGETAPAYTLDVGEDFTDNNESGRLRVQGTSRLEGALTITTGGADVTGSINAKSGLQANGYEQWLDSRGIIKTHSTTIDENVTIPAGTNAFSVGDVVVASGRTIIVNGIWKLL